MSRQTPPRRAAKTMKDRSSGKAARTKGESRPLELVESRSAAMTPADYTPALSKRAKEAWLAEETGGAARLEEFLRGVTPNERPWIEQILASRRAQRNRRLNIEDVVFDVDEEGLQRLSNELTAACAAFWQHQVRDKNGIARIHPVGAEWRRYLYADSIIGQVCDLLCAERDKGTAGLEKLAGLAETRRTRPAFANLLKNCLERWCRNGDRQPEEIVAFVMQMLLSASTPTDLRSLVGEVNGAVLGNLRNGHPPDRDKVRKAVRSVGRYLDDVRLPDANPWLIIGRVLTALGYPGRKSYSLSEAAKKAAQRGSARANGAGAKPVKVVTTRR